MRQLPLVLAIVVMCSLGLQAQEFYFSTSTGPYTELDEPVSLNNDEVWDDPQYEIPIGFTFTYFGYEMTAIYVEDAFLGGILTSSDAETGIAPLILAYNADLIDRGYLEEQSASPIAYQLTGSAGNRILKVQWKNAGFYDDLIDFGTSTDYVNFQLWIYEGSNNVEVHFGPGSIEFPFISFNGESGPSIGLVPAFDFDQFTFPQGATFVTGDVNNPDFVYTNQSELLYLQGTPADGMIYRFTTEVASRVREVAQTVSRIYPNPVADVLHIDIAAKGEEEGNARIYDQLGQLVFEGVLSNGSMRVGGLPAGVYALRVDAGQAVVFIKQ